MQCDVCGHEIVGKPHKVIIEGAKVITCAECAKLGSGYWSQKDEIYQKKATPSLLKSTRLTIGDKHSHQEISSIDDLEIIEGFGSIIKRAREKLGLTHEDLGKMIGEKESVIKKVESEKIIPDIRLATKLERALRIKLLIKQSEMDLNKLVSAPIKEKRSITLGEVVQIKGDKRGGVDED
ncbi:MAG: multiprotein bridging factor aMBF1 [Candidatus Bathyarchaeia archaeon]